MALSPLIKGKKKRRRRIGRISLKKNKFGRINIFWRFFYVSASRSGYGGPQGSHALRSLCIGDQETDHENERLAFLRTQFFSFFLVNTYTNS